MPRYYMTQCWVILHWTIRNKLQWNVNQNMSISCPENASSDMRSAKWQPFCFGFSVFNSLAPGRSEYDSKNVIFNLVLLIGIFRSSHDNALQWMPQDLTDDKSTLVQVMAWCRQAASHYLSQCLPRYMSPYGVPRPQWVNTSGAEPEYSRVLG